MSSIAGVAVTSDGSILQTAKVANAIIGVTELRFSLTAQGENDVEDIMIFPGAWRDTNELNASKGKVAFASKNWANINQFLNYFSRINTQITKIIMESNDVENFDQELIFTEKMPTGKEDEIPFALSPKKQPSVKASGWAEKITITNEDMAPVLWPGLDITLSKMKAGSTINFYITLNGVNKAQELNSIGVSRIG